MKTPSLHLVVKAEWASRVEELRAALIFHTLGDVVCSLDFVEERDFFHSAYSEHDCLIASRLRAVMKEPASFCPWVARIELDPCVLFQTGLVPADIAAKVALSLPLHASVSDESDPLLLLRLRPTLLLPGTTSFSQGSQEERTALRLSTENLVLKACRNNVLRGLRGISQVSVGTDVVHAVHEGDFARRKVTVLETRGGSFAAALRMSAFETTLCTSNDVHSVYNVLGVEAAASVLFEQIKQTLQFDGSYTNERHLMLLCNFCTSQSTLLPISRHGINRSADSGALSRASFEEVTDQLLEAAAYGDSDHTAAFSPAIMVGQRAANVGSGICYPLPSVSVTIAESSSDEEVVFTAVDADIEMLSYQQDVSRIEAPYSDARAGVGIPAALQHSFVTSLPAKTYTPSSPKTLTYGRKRACEPSSPRIP